MSQVSTRQIESVRDYRTGGGRFPILAVTASLVLHALLLAALFHAPLRAPLREPADRVITMRLSVQPPPEPVAAEPRIEPQPEAPDEASTTPTAAEPESAEPHPEDAVANHEPIEREPEIAETGPEAEDPAMLRARILEQVGNLPTDSEPDTEGQLPWASSGAPVRGLPGVRGWISGYVGPVQTSAHTWKENDGSSRGRYVLANGTVVCTRRRAPTIDELMNPWKSMVVTMGGICGRERPAPVDYSDPRVQPPPRRVGGRSLADDE